MIKIIETIVNLTELDCIIRYQRDAKYLIMNEKTFKILLKETISPEYRRTNDGTDYFYGSYKGIPIAICEKLEFGDIDII